MTCERLRFEKMSAIDAGDQFAGMIAILKFPCKVKGVLEPPLPRACIGSVWVIVSFWAG
jgi:hypothetical protein